MSMLTAIVIHGIFNMLITMSGFSTLAAILIVASALLTAILTIIGRRKGDSAASQTQEGMSNEP